MIQEILIPGFGHFPSHHSQTKERNLKSFHLFQILGDATSKSLSTNQMPMTFQELLGSMWIKTFKAAQYIYKKNYKPMLKDKFPEQNVSANDLYHYQGQSKC